MAAESGTQLHHDISRQINAYVCLAVTFTAATATLVLRLCARRITKVALWYDDWLAIAAFLFATLWTALEIFWLKSGLGLHLSEIPMPVDQVLERSRLLLWIEELVYAFSLASAKLAILGFYWRMFKTSNIRIPIQALTVAACIWLILRFFLSVFHCIPVAKFWRTSLEGHCTIDDSKFFVGTVLAHLFIDVAILALPVIEVRKLKMPLTQRLGIMGMFGFGIFVCVASVVVVIVSLNYDASSPEVPYGTAPIIIWATAEINLAIVSACLPMLRPIYLLVMRRPVHSHGSYHHSLSNDQSATATYKLSNMRNPAADDHKTADISETESTTKLASRHGSVSSVATYYNEHGNTTMVTGPVRTSEEELEHERGRSGTVGTRIGNERGDRGRMSPHESDGHLWGNLGGIRVTNETKVTSNRAG